MVVFSFIISVQTLSTYSFQRPSKAPQTPPPTARLLVNVYAQGTTNKLVTFSQNVSPEGENKWEELSIGLTAKQAVDIEVVCINADAIKPVFFDNLEVKVQAVPTVLVVQENHYMPFGLGMRGLDWTLNTGKENKFQYNDGTEKNTDFDLNLYETDFRPYDPQIGRMTGVDALADLFTSISPFSYSYNNPINFNDPTGLCTDCATDDNDFTALAEKYAVRAEKTTVFAPIIETVNTYTKEVKKESEPHLRPDNVNKRIDTFTKGVENVVEDNNLDLLPLGYMFIKAWGLYGKQLLIYGGTTLAGTLYSAIVGGGSFKTLAELGLVDGMQLSSEEILELAEQFLGDGYKEPISGSGRYSSSDGTRVVRIGESDILGQHGGGPHANFETLVPNPLKPGKLIVNENLHIYIAN